MLNSSSFRRATLLALSLVGMVPATSMAQSRGASSSSRPTERRAIARALTRELNHATPDHVRVARFALTSLDVRGSWALADVKPLGRDALDPVSVLLHKRRGEWKVETLGGNLRGSGQQFGVPRSLWRRWNL